MWARSLLLLLVVSAGCSLIPRRGEQAAAERAAQLQALQAEIMRFADEYVGRMSSSVDRFQKDASSTTSRSAAQDWKVSQATSAYTIASGPNPIASALDFVVLATLSRMVMEDVWVRAEYGQRAHAVYEVHEQLETLSWALTDDVLTEDERQRVREMIDDWRAVNPNVAAVAYIHFADFVQSIDQRGTRSDATLLGLVGLDPLSDLDPAVHELAQTRHLAERAIYYAQRVPNLLDMQIERLAYQLAMMPEARDLLANVDRASRAAEQAGDLASAVPEVIAREREAAIDQFMTALIEQEHQTRTLAIELHELLDAGTATSESLNSTIHSLSSLLARIRPTSTGSAGIGAAANPFDIAEYTEAAREFAATSRELERLIRTLDSSTPAVAAATRQAFAEARELVDYIFWRVAALILLSLLFLSAILAARRLRAAQASVKAH
jgi:hypothetical protein